MSRDQYTQCLLLVVHKGDQKKVRKSIRLSRSSPSSCSAEAKAYAILPDVFRKEHPNTVNLFQHNDIHVLSNENMSSLPFFENNELEIIEILFDESSVTSLDPLSVYGSLINKEVVQLLFCSTKVHFKTVSEEIKICPAVDDMNINVMTCLLKHRAAIRCRHRSGESLLHLAAERGPESLVHVILEHGVDVNFQRSDRSTPLHLAALRGLVSMVRLLIKSGADVNCQTIGGLSALHFAVYKGFCEVVEVLLRNGADANVEAGALKLTPVHIAAGNVDTFIIEMLSKYGGRVDVKNSMGSSVLVLAFKRNFPHLLKYLLDCHYLHLPLLMEDSILGTVRSVCEIAQPGTFDSDNYKACLDIVAEHFVKLIVLNLKSVAGKLNEVSSRISEINILKDFKVLCESEVDCMQRQTLGTTRLSFYDVLGKDVSEVACFLRNDSVAEIAASDGLHDKFPIYGRILMHHFQKGRERKLLVEDGIKICHFLFSHFKKLPYELREKILNYLTIRDLLILKNVFVPLKISP